MKKRTKEILAILDEQYGREYVCYLNYETPWQLLIATMLSAQCTDARVNIVTADLFQKYDTLEKFANADLKELEQDIKPTGFYHNKAKNIIACTRDLLYKFGGEVPRSLEDLTSLAGVGRKTANVIRGNIYHDPSVVVDTHVKRISRRLGLTKNEDPEKIETDLMKELPKITGSYIIFRSLLSDGRFVRQEVQNVSSASCKNTAKSLKCNLKYPLGMRI